MGEIVVCVCYGLADWEEQVDEVFYRQLEVASCLQAMTLMRTLTTDITSGGTTQQDIAIQEVLGLY